MMEDVRLGSPERFGYEWKWYSDVLPESRDQLQRWLGPVSLESFFDKDVLDAGCGMGRNSYWIAKAGARKVTAIDIDENSLNSARNNLKGFSNVTVKKCSIYDASAESLGVFDRVICIGVLHHLSTPEVALSRLWECVKPGGELILWCYASDGNEKILPLIEAARFVGSRLPIRLSHIFSKGIAAAIWPCVRLFPWRTEYYRRLRQISYENFESIVFDQILPRISNYWSQDEIAKLVFPLDGMAFIHLVQGNSWNVVVKKALTT